ncbi:MAG: hypothetical protein HKP57_04335 [Halobacteria archaeon]|nr:hypothetical protein [Halobacteria archaeon]
MKQTWIFAVMSLLTTMSGFADQSSTTELQPLGKGSAPVCSTNMRVAPEFSSIGDDAMHDILLGKRLSSEQPGFITEILAHRESAWIVDVYIPDTTAMYGPASGRQMPVLAYITYPCAHNAPGDKYPFPYHDARYGMFENMLSAGADPVFADANARYPLIVLSHGSSSHGIYDVAHAQDLARHGYIVAVLFYGDDRAADPATENSHLGFMRPLFTKAVIDSLVVSQQFGKHIDADKIGVSGHSFGGFTALALAGGPVEGNTESVSDARVKAAVLAAPWMGHPEEGRDVFPFGPENRELKRVNVPVLWFYGTKDSINQPRFIVDAAGKTSGPGYIIELVDQPHVFEGPSWADRNAWELLFFNAYLKDDASAFNSLKRGSSMKGGNADAQLFDHQK